MCDNLLFESEDLPVGQHVTVVTTPFPRAKPLRALRRSASKVQAVEEERSDLVPLSPGEPRDSLEVGHLLRMRSQSTPTLLATEGSSSPILIADDSENFVIDAEDLRDDPEVRMFWGRRTQPRRTCKLPKNKRLPTAGVPVQVNTPRVLPKPEDSVVGEDDDEEDELSTPKTCDDFPIKSSWNVMNPRTGKRESKSKRPCLTTMPGRIMQVSYRQARKMPRWKSQATKDGKGNEPTGSENLAAVDAEATVKVVPTNEETSKQLKRGKPAKSKRIGKNDKQKKIAKINAKSSKNKVRVSANIKHSRELVPGAPHARKITKKSKGPELETGTEQASTTSTERYSATGEATAPKKLAVITKKSKKLVPFNSETSQLSVDLTKEESATSDTVTSKSKKKEPENNAKKGSETKKKKAPACRTGQATITKEEERPKGPNHLDLDVCQVLTFKKEVYLGHAEKTRMRNQGTVHSTISSTARRVLAAKQMLSAFSVLKPIAMRPTLTVPSPTPAQPRVTEKQQPPTPTTSACKELVTKQNFNSYTTLTSISIPPISKSSVTEVPQPSVGTPSNASIDAKLAQQSTPKPTIQKPDTPTSSPTTVQDTIKKTKKTKKTNIAGEFTLAKRPQGRPRLSEDMRKIPSPRKKKRAEKSLTCPVCAHQEDYVVLLMRHLGVEHPGVAEYVRQKVNSPYDPHWDDMPKVVNGVIADVGETTHFDTMRYETQVYRVDNDKSYKASTLKITEAMNEAVRMGLHLLGPSKAQATTADKTIHARRQLKLAPAETPTGGCFVPLNSSGLVDLRPPITLTNYEGQPRLGSMNTHHGTLQMVPKQRMQGQLPAHATIQPIGKAPSTSICNASSANPRFVVVDLRASEYRAQSFLTTTASTSRHAQASSSASTQEFEDVEETENFLGSFMSNTGSYVESPHSSSSAYFSGSGNFLPDSRTNYNNPWIMNSNSERYTSNDNSELSFEQDGLVNEFPSTSQYTTHGLNAVPPFLSYEDGIDVETNYGQRQMWADVDPNDDRNRGISSLEDELSPYIKIGQLPTAGQHYVLDGNSGVAQGDGSEGYHTLPELNAESENVSEGSLYRMI